MQADFLYFGNGEKYAATSSEKLTDGHEGGNRGGPSKTGESPLNGEILG